MNDKNKISLRRTRNTPFITLRVKGYIAYGSLIVFTACLSIFILHQKAVLLEQLGDMQEAYDIESRLREMQIHAGHAAHLYIDGSNKTTHHRYNLKMLQDTYRDKIVLHMDAGPGVTELGKVLSDLHAAFIKQDPQNLNNVFKQLQDLLTKLVDSRKQFRKNLVQDFRARSDHVAMASLLFGLLGLALFGTISGLFFARLTSDILLLKRGAEAIVEGDRTNLIPINRNDEVGHLGDSINHIADDLEENERKLEIERHKTFHQDKMAAIGTLSAGIAHEVGNPIAAISAIVREIKAATQNGTCPFINSDDVCKLDAVLEHTERLRGITREISGFARPQSGERQLLDINGLIRSTCSFMRYDGRWKKIVMQLALDENLPAIEGVGDQLTQVMMNLLVNAADALDGVVDRTPSIRIATKIVDKDINICIEDNGQGMEKATLDRAMQTFFTTKESGKGTGLGLSLCQAIVQAHGGRMEIDSVPGVGTTVNIFLSTHVEPVLEASGNG